MRGIQNVLFGLLIAAIVVVVDQEVKRQMVALLADKPFISITPFFNLVMVWNKGISFGMFSGMDARDFLIAMKSVIILLLLVWLFLGRERMLYLPLGLIIGGAAGNVIDRVRWGAVADFFDFYIGGYHWPAFNIADSAIVMGVVLLLALSFFSKKSAA